MIIMTIFLFLTVIFIVGTVIYLKHKKNSQNLKLNQLSPNKQKENAHKSKRKQLANLLDFKINGNMICTGNRYSYIIRLGNIDFNMLSSQEQDSIESILIQTALAIDYPIQFFSTTEFIDTSKIINLIKENKTTNLKVKDYKKHLLDYLENLMENRTISIVRNYAIISYDGLYENAVQELERKATSFKGNLLRAKIVCETLSEDELYNLIYRELNKNSSLTISPLKKGVKNLYVGKKQKTKEKRD